MERKWFRDKDGTYYRNCNLISSELARTWNPLRRRKLQREWDEVFSEGVTRKATLGPGDVEVQQRPFREAYPNHPGLWQLDECGDLAPTLLVLAATNRTEFTRRCELDYGHFGWHQSRNPDGSPMRWRAERKPLDEITVEEADAIVASIRQEPEEGGSGGQVRIVDMSSPPDGHPQESS